MGPCRIFDFSMCPQAMGRLAAAMGVEDVGAAIFDVMETVGLPTRLTEVGFSADRIAEAVRGILAAAVEGPRPVTPSGR